MKKIPRLIIMFFLSFSVGCSTPKNFTPAAISSAINPIAKTTTETSLPSTTTTPMMPATPLLTLTPTLTIAIPPIFTLTTAYRNSSTSTPLLLPVTDKVRDYFLHTIPGVGKPKNMELIVTDIGYEIKTSTNLTLVIDIQCLSGPLHCSLTFARDAFLYVFSDPEPQPNKIGMFPNNLEEFQINGYDENMNQVETVTGKWSDLVEYEKGNLIWDDLIQRLLYH